MARSFYHQDVAEVPRGWRVRTVRSGSHEVRIAFPPGSRRKGAGRVVSILHPNGENPSCRMRNPAELMLMGANPTTSERKRSTRERAEKIRAARLNPLRMLNQHFSKNEKMELGRLGIKWSEIQTPRDVKRARRALKDANKIRARFSNPVELEQQREAAQEIYTGFHDEPAEKRLVLEEPHIPAGAYPELGLLVSIQFRPTAKAKEPYVKNFVCEKEDVHVLGSLTRDQIYFAGGDQELDDKTLDFFGWDGHSPTMVLGTALEIVYLARKYHEAVPSNGRGKLVEWVHPFGEEGGEKPLLVYDREHKRMLLRRGAYEIADEGIRN
jgi:hypothetical protein